MNSASFTLRDIPSTSTIKVGNDLINMDAITTHVHEIANALLEANINCVAIYLDNSPEWLYASLATIINNITTIPLPIFFSAQQIEFILRSTPIDSVIGNNPFILSTLLPGATIKPISPNLFIAYIARPSLLGAFRGIITFTSGTTSTPKGVLLPYQNILKEINSLTSHLSSHHAFKSYLAITPLSILLENILAIATLTKGGCVYVNPVSAFLDLNTFSLRVNEVIDYINQMQLDTMLLMPLFLAQMISAIEKNPDLLPASLKFIGVGSAVISTRLLERAELLGLPVYQGYGLSESCSVVSMNTVDHNKIGSAGKILPNIEVKIDDRNHILVRGNLLVSYLGGPLIDPHEFFDTGDLGYIKDDYLYVTGRQKNVMVLANGRNLSPEWLEQEILQLGMINHVVIIAEARPFVTIIISPTADFDHEEFELRLARLNKQLPVYAKIQDFVIASEQFTHENGMLSNKNTPLSKIITEKYREEINLIYHENSLPETA